MKTGNLQRRWSEVRPPVYDKETRYVCLEIVNETQVVDEVEVQGFSYIQIQIDPLIDYGHIKSQLIEAGFAHKDEFGLLMNVVDSILDAASNAGSWSAFKNALDTDDVNDFKEFCQFRAMCAQAAHEVMSHY